jgi:hypothetical protein
MKRKLAQAGIPLIIALLVCSLAIAKKCRDKKASLPAQAEKTLTASYPGASIKEVRKDEGEVKVFEAELALADGNEMDVVVTADGTILETGNEIKASSLPFDASKVIPAGAEIKEIESEVTYAVLKPVALDQPKTTYDLEVLADGKKIEFEVAADGTVLKQKAKGDEDEKKGDKDDEDKD